MNFIAILQGHVESRSAHAKRCRHHDAGTDDMHALRSAASLPAPSPFNRSCKKNTRTRLRQVGVFASLATERARV
jgi:hypothetical protein